MYRSEVRIVFQQIFGPRPPDQRIYDGIRKIGTQLMNERCREERVADSCERDYQQFHRTVTRHSAERGRSESVKNAPLGFAGKDLTCNGWVLEFAADA